MSNAHVPKLRWCCTPRRPNTIANDQRRRQRRATPPAGPHADGGLIGSNRSVRASRRRPGRSSATSRRGARSSGRRSSSIVSTGRPRPPGTGHSGRIATVRSSGRTSEAIAASTPFTNRPLSSVEKRFASSTASSMTTATGTSRPLEQLERARRITLRSSTGIRSSVQPLALAAIARRAAAGRLRPRATSSVVSSSGSSTWRSSVGRGDPFACAS